jgi:hypothetical protein
MNKKDIDDDMRKHVSEFLPAAISKALESYHSFAGQEIPEDSKGFSSHHSACKVAISHVELLLKLAKWAELPDQKSTENQEYSKILKAAEKDLKLYQESIKTE